MTDHAMTRKTGFFNLMNNLDTGGRWTQALNTLIGVLVFLIPFPRMTALYEIIFYTALTLALFLHLTGKRRFSLNSPLTLSFAIFLAWISVGLFFALDPLNSMNDLYGHFIKYLLLYYLIVNSFCSCRGVMNLVWMITTAAGLFAGSAIFSHYVFLQNPLSSRLGIPAIQGLTSDYIGYFTLPALLLSFMLVQESASTRGKIFSLMLAAGTAAATILTQSRATFIALFCSLILLYGRKKAALGAAAILLLSLMYFLPTFGDRFTIQQFTKNERIGIYLTTWHVIRDYPLAGIGFGMQTYENPKLIDLDAYSRRIPSEHRLDPPIRSPHNTLLDTTVRTGSIGLLIYLYMQIVFMRMGWTVIRNGQDGRIRRMGLCVMSVYVAIFIQGLFSDGAFGPQALMLYLSFALMTILWKIVRAGGNVPAPVHGESNNE
jgi:hypothetical protein